MTYSYIQTKNNVKCVGPCYPPNTKITHPSIDKDVVKKYAFCPTKMWIDKDKNEQRIEDECFVPTVKTNIITGMRSSFTVSQFLLMYNITTIELLYEWIEKNKNMSIYTTIRLINCSLKEFDIKIIDERLIVFVIKVLKKHYSTFSNDKTFVSKLTIDNVYKHIDYCMKNNIKTIEEIVQLFYTNNKV